METTLFDSTGHPVAYVADDDDRSIYLWSGHPVAYLRDDLMYGWSGHHLGFFVDGVVYDARCQCVGSTLEKCRCAPHAEPAKYAKYAKRAMWERRMPYSRRSLSAAYSDQPLEDLLKQGAITAV